MSNIDISEISKGSYYFKLPSMYSMMATYFALQIISSFIATGDALLSLATTALSFSLAFASSHLLFKATRDFGASKPSRFFGMFCLQAFVSVLCQTVAFFLASLSKTFSLFVLLFGAFCPAFILVSLSEVFAESTTLSVLIWAVSTGNAMLYASKFISPLVIAFLVALSFSGAMCLLRYVNSSPASLKTPKPTKMFRPYLEYKLSGRVEGLEALLKCISRSSKIRLTAVCLEKDRMPLFLVNLSVHFGPFDGIGSSSLPSDAFLASKERLGAVALVTHPFSSHERDITSKKDVRRILDRSLEELEMYSLRPVVKMTPFFLSSRGAFDVWVSICGDMAICVASSKDPRIDDLPEGALEELLKESARFGINCVYDIDAHNNISFPLPNKPSFEARYDDLLECYRNALRSALSHPKSSARVGYASVPLEGRHDVGPLGISALVFDFGTKKQALVIVDGNNMVEGLVERVVGRVEELGVSDVLVITNDNHVLTGVFNVDGGYYPVGARDGEPVVEGAAHAVEGALRDLSECRVRLITAEVGDAPLLGDGLGELLKVTLKALRRFKRSLAFYFLYSLLVSELGVILGFW